MLTVYKFNIDLTQKLVIPGFKQLLDINSQGPNICAWALVNTDDNEDPPKKIQVVIMQVVIKGTGHKIDPIELMGMKFFKTFQMDGGALIFHVWVPEDIKT